MASSDVEYLWDLRQWPLIYVVGPFALAVLCVVLRDMSSIPLLFGKSKVLPSPITEKDNPLFKKEPKSMGVIEPLSTLDWATEEPRKIYKFSPKYFLTMGLTNTNINFITQMDRQYLERMTERQKILATHPNALKCLPSAIPMVNELYEYLITEYLPQRFPTMFKAGLKHTANLVTGKLLPSVAPKDPIEALRLLALNVDEDFLMLLPAEDGDGHSLQSFVWCYPVGFDAGSKLGLKLRDAHKPVPGYKDKLQSSMDRYFSKLEVGRVVYRVNWAIATNASLCEDGQYHFHDDEEIPVTEEIDVANCWVRCELQTLFALPKTGGRILSVHLYLYPLQQIKDEGLGEALCEAVDGLKLGNVPAFWRYKRAALWQDKVKEFMRS